MHGIPFDRILESALRLHQICGDSVPSIQQWSVLPTLFLKYGRPGNRLLHRCRRILSGIPVDGMHFSSAGIRTGQSAVFDANVRNGIPTSSFWMILNRYLLFCVYQISFPTTKKELKFLFLI